jgi:hypothetical protein
MSSLSISFLSLTKIEIAHSQKAISGVWLWQVDLSVTMCKNNKKFVRSASSQMMHQAQALASQQALVPGTSWYS